MIKGYDFPRNVRNSDADFTEEDVQMHHSVRGAMFSSDPKVVDGVGGTDGAADPSCFAFASTRAFVTGPQ